jgi:hypothetical protein
VSHPRFPRSAVSLASYNLRRTCAKRSPRHVARCKVRNLKTAVTVRLRRQLRLVEAPVLQFHALIDETALRRPVLASEAHREQLRFIVERASLPMSPCRCSASRLAPIQASSAI